MYNDEVRDNAMRLLRAARALYAEQHDGTDEALRPGTALELYDAGNRIELPPGFDPYAAAVGWLEDNDAIEPYPPLRDAMGFPAYRITARGMEML
jgi:hypothetical protein